MDTNPGTGNENLPPPTLCRNGCGFYGNSQFDGMCSKCYKDMIKKRNQNATPNQLQGHVSPTGATESMNTTSSLSSVSATNTTTSSISSTSVDTRISPNIETASPTVPSTASTAQDKTANDDPEGASAGAEASTSEKGDEDSPDKGDKKPKKNRCHTCKKKLGLTGFECRCGGLYCGLHRYSDKHDCTFNYKELGQEQIRKNNPVVVGSKIQKI